MNKVVLVSQLVVCLVSLIINAAVSQNVDLPRFLPNHGNSVYQADGLLRSWPAGGPKKLWQREIGWGKAAVVEVMGCPQQPTLANGRMYIRGNRVVACYQMAERMP